MLKRCVLLLLGLPLFCLAATAQEADEPEVTLRELYRIEKGAAVRQRVEEVKLPILKAKFQSLTVCGSDTYRMKDAAGGYLIFTLHSADAPGKPRPITIDNPLGAEPDFAHELTGGGEEERLLTRLLQEWRNATFTTEKLRTFERLSRLKSEAAVTRALDRLSAEDSDLLDMWMLIRGLESRQKQFATGAARLLQ